MDVTVTISGHAGTDLNLGGGRLSNDTLTFTPVNWDRPQTVTVAAAHDDDGVTDDETLTHTAAGGEYAGVARDLPATVDDNDPLGISITPLELKVDESDSADYAVWLDTEPTVEVTVTISGHAGTDLILSGPTLTSDALTFTADNWGTPQTVTVTAAHDDDTDDDTGTLTNTAAGGEYEGFDRVLSVTTDDNTGDLRLVDGTPHHPRTGARARGAWRFTTTALGEPSATTTGPHARRTWRAGRWDLSPPWRTPVATPPRISGPAPRTRKSCWMT